MLGQLRSTDAINSLETLRRGAHVQAGKIWWSAPDLAAEVAAAAPGVPALPDACLVQAVCPCDSVDDCALHARLVRGVSGRPGQTHDCPGPCALQSLVRGRVRASNVRCLCHQARVAGGCVCLASAARSSVCRSVRLPSFTPVAQSRLANQAGEGRDEPTRPSKQVDSKSSMILSLL